MKVRHKQSGEIVEVAPAGENYFVYEPLRTYGDRPVYLLDHVYAVKKEDWEPIHEEPAHDPA